jgi:starch synthase
MAKSPRSRKSVPAPVDTPPHTPQADSVAGARAQTPAPQADAVPTREDSAAVAPAPRRVTKRAAAVSGPEAPVSPDTPATPETTIATPARTAAAPVKAAGKKPAARKTEPKATSSRKTAAPRGAARKASAAPGDTAARPAAPPRVRKARTLAEAVQSAVPDPTAPAVAEPERAAPELAAPVPAVAVLPAAPAAAAEPVVSPQLDVAPAAAAPLDVTARGGHGRPLRILMVASEAVPFAKTGGLADVVAALPKALGALGHDVTVVIPRYRGIGISGTPTRSFAVAMGGHHYAADVYVRETSPGVRVALVDHPAFFDRDALYGLGSHDYGDNPRRFAFLCLAALEFMRLEGKPVDVVHAHDWQAGLAPVYVKTRYATDPFLGGAATVFTIHNIAYQGNCSSEWLPQLGLGWDLFTTEGLEFWLHLSLLKGGIMFADLVTTVSPRYAQELMTREFAFGFEGILQHRAADLMGILNGIDAEVWNPATDRYLPSTYRIDELAGKATAKQALLEAYGLPADADAVTRPVIAMISRMVDQKGLDLIASISEQLPHLGAAFVILGTGEPWYEEMWRSLARRFPDRIGVRIGFDEPLSHVIEAGADLFMMPSRFEPCGLNQMYSLRYGTLPVVRATGGLDDTVQNYDPASGAGNGFKFYDASGEALLGTLRWALHVYQSEPDRWRQLQRAGMTVDFSWSASARAYLDAYERARSHAAGRLGASV